MHLVCHLYYLSPLKENTFFLKAVASCQAKCFEISVLPDVITAALRLGLYGNNFVKFTIYNNGNYTTIYVIGMHIFAYAT